MKELEQKIADFCNDQEIVNEHLAMLKVGFQKGDSPAEIMRIITGSILLRFHQIPPKVGNS